jgi:hypothetical protein
MTHPITPPPELVQQWFEEASELEIPTRCHIATHAAQWGADQELGACCEWLKDFPHFIGIEEQLRAARRPQPQSMKELALEELYAAERLYPADWTAIRRALETLPND